MYVVMVVAVSGLLSLGIKKLFYRRGNWLPITATTILPPLLFVPFGIFGLLRDIGAAAESSGQTPPNVVDDFALNLQTLLAKGAIWLLIACVISIVVVRLVERNSSQ